ncbi:MAG: DNA (cytosine-5-)-methyltransferase [Dehalococcoidia bacterium]
MNELSLFTGAGGGVLGSILLGWRTIGYVEKDDYCQRVIAQRIKDGLIEEAPIFGDIRTFNDSGCAELYRGVTDIISAGFPCQPFSVAGQRKGESDERNLWPDTIRAIRIVRPRYVLLENVPGLLAHEYFGTILGDLAESGFDAKWKVISAAELGAPHRRDRLWIVADSNTGLSDRQGQELCSGRDSIDGGSQDVAYPINSADQRGREQDRNTNSLQKDNRATVFTREPSRAGDVADTERNAKRPTLRETSNSRWTDSEQCNRDSMGHDLRNGSGEMADTAGQGLEGYGGEHELRESKDEV